MDQIGSNGGILKIYPLGTAKDVACDVLNDVENCVLGKGAWTVIQRRGQFGNPKDFFTLKRWKDYANGFGNVLKEYWMGLKDVAAITTVGRWELRVDLVDYNGKTYRALYSDFKVSDEEDNFRLSLTGYDATQSNIRDSFTYSNGMQFSTADRDNDVASGHCAASYGGPWWHKSCTRSSLNGKNFFDVGKNTARGIMWYNKEVIPDKPDFSWPNVEMKIRRKA